MLLRQGDLRDFGLDRRLACTLAAVAGAVNAAGFRAFGLFSANMTGNASALADRVATGAYAHAAFFLLIVVTFICGALAATVLTESGRARGIADVHALGIMAEAVLMGALGGFLPLLPVLERGPILVPAISFLMGLQNAVTTRLSNGRVRTTHVSGIATDIGIELGVLISQGSRPADALVHARLHLHALTFTAFIAGGAVGVWSYQVLGERMLLGAGLILGVIAAPGILRSRLVQRSFRPK